MLTKTKRLIIFDFDGVIANTLPDILENSRLASEKIGYPRLPTKEIVSHLEKMSFENLGRALEIPEDMIADFVRNTLSFFYSQDSVLDIFPDMKETLNKLAENNTLAIITNNSRKAVDQFLSQNSLKDKFELIADNDVPGSRAEKISSTQKHFNMEKGDTYFVGDAVSDVEAAKEASVHSIAAAWGNQDPQMLRDSYPDFLINTPDEILSIISNYKK